MAKKSGTRKPTVKKKKSKAGRKKINWTKWIKLIKLALINGDYVKDICKKIGITQNTWYKWLKIDPKFKKFIESVEKERLSNIVSVAKSSLIQGMQSHIIKLKKQVIDKDGIVHELTYDKYLQASAYLIGRALETNGTFKVLDETAPKESLKEFADMMRNENNTDNTEYETIEDNT